MKKYTQNFNEFLSESEVSEKATWKAKGPFIAVGYGRHSGGEDEVIDFKDEFKSEKDAQKWIDKEGNRGLSWSIKTGAEYNHYELGIEEGLDFTYDGTTILNPFKNEDGFKTVDPVKYYGKDYKNTILSEIVDDMEELIKKYESWKESEGEEFSDEVGKFLLKFTDKYKKVK